MIKIVHGIWCLALLCAPAHAMTVQQWLANGMPASSNPLIASAGQVLIGNGTSYAESTISGDGTLASGGAITITKTNGVAFAASATTDTTNANNITSGILALARMNNAGVFTGDATSTFPVITIGNGAITAAKMVNSGVFTGDATTTFPALTIGNGAITAVKMVNSGVFTGDVTTTFPAITIGANAITTSKINAGAVTEAKITLADVTTGNVSSSAHGLAPKTPADATQFLNGAATGAYAQVKDSDLSTSDITTNNVSATKHGFAPKFPNNTTTFLRGDGTYAAPSAASINIGGSGNTMLASGLISANLTTVGNGADQTEDTLQSYTLPASALNNVGSGIRIKCWGTYTSTTDTRAIKVYFGSAVIFTITPTASTTGVWHAEIHVSKIGSSQQLYEYWYTHGTFAGGTGITTAGGNNLTETDTNTIIIKTTGKESTSSTANTVVSKGQMVWFDNQ